MLRANPPRESPGARGVFLGPYRVLGRASLSTRTLALVGEKDDRVLLRLPRGEISADAAGLAAWEHAVERLVKVQHPLFELPAARGRSHGVPWLASWWEEGPTADAPTAGWTRPLAPPSVLALGLELAQGLAAWHRRYDDEPYGRLSPGRVILGADDKVHLRGLGIALPDVLALPQDPSRLAWLAPEQLDGGTPTAAADSYALSLLLLALLEGRAPFLRPTAEATRSAVLDGDLTLGDTLEDLPGIDPALSALLRRAVLPDPALRPNLVSELLPSLARAVAPDAADALVRAWQRIPTESPPLAAVSAPPVEEELDPLEEFEPLSEPYAHHTRPRPPAPAPAPVAERPAEPPRRRAAWPLAALAAAALLGGVTWALSGAPAGKPPVTAPAASSAATQAAVTPSPTELPPPTAAPAPTEAPPPAEAPVAAAPAVAAPPPVTAARSEAKSPGSSAPPALDPTIPAAATTPAPTPAAAPAKAAASRTPRTARLENLDVEVGGDGLIVTGVLSGSPGKLDYVPKAQGGRTRHLLRVPATEMEGVSRRVPVPLPGFTGLLLAEDPAGILIVFEGPEGPSTFTQSNTGFRLVVPGG